MGWARRRKFKWRLLVYPKGDGDVDCDDSVSIFLQILSNNPEPVQAGFKLFVLDSKNQKQLLETFEQRDYPDYSDTSQTGYGSTELISQDDIDQNSSYLPGGNLTIVCELTVHGPKKILSGSNIQEEKEDLQVRGQEQFSEHLGSLIASEEFSDVDLECDGEVFNSHRVILATRSPVFRAMFRADMKENKSKKISIVGIRPEVMAEMLNFIYTGVTSKEIVEEDAGELLAAANQYQLDVLKRMCERVLCSSIRVENSIEYLVLGHLHEAPELKRRAIRSVSNDLAKIVNSDVYKDFLKKHPELVLELTKSMVEEEEEGVVEAGDDVDD